VKTWSYWLGLLLVAAITLVVYRLDSLPETTYLFAEEQSILSHEDHDGPSNHPRVLQKKLKDLGITFPPGSLVRRETSYIGFATFGDSDWRADPLLVMKNTWRNHQKFRALGNEVTGQLEYYRTCSYGDFTFRIGKRRFGLREYGSAEYPGDAYSPVTNVLFGADDRMLPTFPNENFVIALPKALVVYRYRAWPVLLLLALGAYTIAYHLRRPIWRALSGIFHRRRSDA